MNDIVGRLAKRATVTEIIKDNPKIYYDAMYEIERLRAENETLRRDVKTAILGDSAELQDVKRENEKLREALKALAKHCNEMEAQNYDYHTMGEGGAPRLSEPLANACAAIKESGDE